VERESVLPVLFEERAALLKELDALETVILRFGGNLTSTSLNANQSQANSDENRARLVPNRTVKPIQFPKNGDVRQQILFLIEHHFKKAVRYVELQAAFEQLSQTSRKIRQYLIDMKRDGTLGAIRFNHSHASVFVGLPEWIIETDEGPRFTPEHAQDPDLLPKGIWQSEREGVVVEVENALELSIDDINK
jgi:hypothetical protein